MALTAKEDLERWFLAKPIWNCSSEQHFVLNGDSGMVNGGKILELESPRRLSYSWEAMEPTPTAITFDLKADQNGTRLELVHSGIGEGEAWDQYYTAVNSGWDLHLDNLAAWLETGICEAHDQAAIARKVKVG